MGGTAAVHAIDVAELRPRLAELAGRQLFLHLETTAGAYTAGGFGAFIRNARLEVRRVDIAGTGPFRAGIETASGWVYAEGLTHWATDGPGRILMAGHDAQGRVTVVCELAPEAFPMAPAPQRLWPVARAAVVTGARAPSEERAVLAVFAHPDDETFGCGGTLARYTQAGVPVTLACMTRGEMGRNMGTPTFATRESLAAVRVAELTAACAELGIRDLRLLGVWDKTAEFWPTAELADRILAILREVRPSLVITQHPEFGGHPDHCAAGRATLAAILRLPPGDRPQVRCMGRLPNPDTEGFVVDIAGAPAEAKLAATRAHRSQSEPMAPRIESWPEWLRVERQFPYPL